MAASFAELRARVAHLCNAMLPNIRDDLAYTADEYDRVRAFIVLSHAAIEEFIEQRVLGEVAWRHHEWTTSKRPSGVLMGVLTFYSTSMPGQVSVATAPTNGDKVPSWAARDLSRRLRLCVTALNEQIRTKNHGIKEEDVLAMVLPLGIAVDDLDGNLLSNLESFGKQRGKIAHTGIGVIQVPDPVDIAHKVESLLVGLEQLDQQIAQAP